MTSRNRSVEKRQGKAHALWLFLFVCISATMSAQTVGGVDLGNLPKYLFVFTNGSNDANWQGATKGFAGDVAVNGAAGFRTSGGVPYAGTVSTNGNSLGQWAGIVSANAGQASSSLNQTNLISGLTSDFNNALSTINNLAPTAGYNGVDASVLNGLNTQDGVGKTYVIHISSGLGISSQLTVTGDANDFFILVWDTDNNPANGYQGQVKFQSGGAIVPAGGLKATNFINVAGDINSSGGGSNPPAPYPQGPRYNDGTGALINGGADFSGGGFFTGYWLTTGDPANGQTSSLSNGIFVGGWYSSTNQFSMTSGTSGVYMTPPPTIGLTGNVFNDLNGMTDNTVNGSTAGVSGGLYANLYTAAGVFAASVPVASGTYSFASVSPNTTYQVAISTIPGSAGSTPSSTLPAGWVSTGENLGTGAGNDGNVNGILTNIAIGNANVNNANFGIEQPPTASGSVAASQKNPGGTTSVAVPATIFGGTDPNGGTITGLTITAFPANATSITINGTNYTAGTFPLAGVNVPANTSGQPTQKITVDPIDGAVTVTIPFTVTDNAGKPSTASTASMPFTAPGANTISGNVFNDLNGLTDNTVNGTGTNAGGLNAVLIDATSGSVVATTTVGANGTYSFSNIANGNYNVEITTATATIGKPAPAVILPSGWVSTGEHLGTAAGSDGAVNGILPLGTVNANVTNANFGIEQPPTASGSAAPSQVNPGGTTSVTVPATIFGGTDPNGGTVANLTITGFPTNATSITINGTNYTSTTFPGAGVTVPANTSGQPTQTISVDPIDGAVTVNIPFTVTDNAGKPSATGSTASMPFTATPTFSIAGNVFNDLNGLTDNTVNGTGTNVGGLNAVLVDASTGNVAATTAVNANGAYGFSNIPAGNYNVVITTATASAGSPAPAVTLPSGWVSTGEHLGTAAGSDGAVNGILPLGTVNASVTNANFGIEQPPTASGSTAPSQANPGGTTSVTVPAALFSGTDANGGTVISITITGFPTNATSITINGTNYTSTTFPGAGVTVPANTSGQPAQTISVDPADGAITVSIPFTVTDNAGKPSAPSAATIPFTAAPTCPDLTPRITATPNKLVGPNAVEFTVRISEINGINTDGTPIILYVQKNGLMSNFQYNASQTTNVQFQAVQNSLFTVDATSNTLYYIFTANSRVLNNSSLQLAFTISFDPGQRVGRQNINVFLGNGNGGECNITNDQYGTTVTYSY